MAKPAVWLATIESGSLGDLLKTLVPTTPHVYLESESQVCLVALVDLLAAPGRVRMPAVRWSKGRAFGVTLELAWRRVDPLLVELHVLTETGQLPDIGFSWSASQWNDRFDPLDVNLPPRDVLLLKPAYNGGTALRCLDYRCNGTVVITRLYDVITTDSKVAQRL
jgi:hypothetical protein